MEVDSVAVVVGRNCKRLRSDARLTQDQLARHARQIGLRWTTTSVGDFENARSAPTFATVLSVVLALSRAIGRPVLLGELLDGDGVAALTSSIAVENSVLADVCRGEPFKLSPSKVRAKTRSATTQEIHALVGGDVAALVARAGLAERRLAQRLGVSPNRLAALSSTLWQRTFTEERDRRAGTGANAQKRGQIARSLQSELEKALGDGDD